MIGGVFIVEGGIGDLSEKVFKQLKEEVLNSTRNTSQVNAIKEVGGVPHGIKVKSNKICLNKKNNLLRSRVIFELS